MSESLSIDPDDCDVGVARWRAMASEVAELRNKAVWWATELQLDDLPSMFRSNLSEFAEETNLSADLLAAIAQRSREADAFDGSYEGLGESVGLVDSLTGSLNDGKGAAWSYHLDPEPADSEDEHVVHMGYVPLFGADGPQPTDVRQGTLGDCVLLAIAAGIASTDPARLQEIITDNGDGTYTVFIDGEYVTVDDEIVAGVRPDGSQRLMYAQDAGVLWPLILEKAWAARYDYEYGNASSLDPDDVAEALGYESENLPIEESQVFGGMYAVPAQEDNVDAIVETLEAGGTVIAYDFDAFSMDPGDSGHAWTVLRVEETDGELYVVVRNPWGQPGIDVSDDGGWNYAVNGVVGDEMNLEVPDGAAGADMQVIDENDGVVRVPIDIFLANFDNVVISTAATS